MKKTIAHDVRSRTHILAEYLAARFPLILKLEADSVADDATNDAIIVKTKLLDNEREIRIYLNYANCTVFMEMRVNGIMIRRKRVRDLTHLESLLIDVGMRV